MTTYVPHFLIFFGLISSTLLLAGEPKKPKCNAKEITIHQIPSTDFRYATEKTPLVYSVRIGGESSAEIREALDNARLATGDWLQHADILIGIQQSNTIEVTSPVQARQLNGLLAQYSSGFVRFEKDVSREPAKPAESEEPRNKAHWIEPATMRKASQSNPLIFSLRIGGTASSKLRAALDEGKFDTSGWLQHPDMLTGIQQSTTITVSSKGAADMLDAILVHHSNGIVSFESKAPPKTRVPRKP